MKPIKIFYIFLIIFLSITTSVKAQWIQTNGPYGGEIRCLAINGSDIYAGTYGGGIFLSTDNGGNWSEINNGITSLYYSVVGSIIIDGIITYAGTNGGIFKSTNKGNSWSLINNNIHFSDGSYLAINGSNIFAGVLGKGIYRSTNNGNYWSLVNNGLTNTNIRTLTILGTNIYAGTEGGGIFLSTNNGDSWSAINSGLTNTNVNAITVNGSNIFAGTYGGGIFLSTNNGNSWNAVNSGLTFGYIKSLVAYGTKLFAGTYGGGIFFSTNNGSSWTLVNNGLMNTNILSLVYDGTKIFAGTLGSGVFFSNNNGSGWTEVNTGLRNSDVRSIIAIGTNLFAGTYGGGIFLSTNNGNSWIDSGLTNKYILSLACKGTNLFAGTTGGGIFLSTNNGNSWNAINTGLTNYDIKAILVKENNIFAGTYSGGVFISTNIGNNWNEINSGLASKNVLSLATAGTAIFAGTSGGIYRSINNGNSWEAINIGLTNTYITSIVTIGTNIFAATFGGGIFLSTNNGNNWMPCNIGLTNTIINSLIVNGTNLFAGTTGGGIFLSTNNGNNWTEINTNLTSGGKSIYSLAINETNIYAGTFGSGVWSRPITDLIPVSNAISLISPGNNSQPGYNISTLKPLFYWNGITSASNYGLNLYKKNNIGYELVYNSDNITNTSIVLPSGTISDGSQYYWQVRAKVNNNWTPYSSPYYFNVNFTSLSPILLLSSNSIQAGGTESFSGNNFSKNSQVNAIISSDNGYNKIITQNTDNNGYFTYSINLNEAGIYSIYCKDIKSGNCSSTKSFEVNKVSLLNSDFHITHPTSGIKLYIDESSLLVEWTDVLLNNKDYPISGCQRAYSYFIEVSSDNGSNWKWIDLLNGYEDINKQKTFSKVVKNFSLPASNYLLRIRDYFVNDRCTPAISMQVLSTEAPVLSAEFLWDYSYTNFTDRPLGVVTDGTSRFYIKVTDPDSIISQVTFYLDDDDKNTGTQTLGKLMKASNIESYSEEANNANQLNVVINQPQVKNEFWCWYVAPDDFNGVNPSTNELTAREVKVKIKAIYRNGSSKEVTKKIIIKRPPLVLVHGLNSDPSIWNYFAHSPLLSNFQIYKLKIGGQDSFENNAKNILEENSSCEFSIVGVIKNTRKSSIACNQVYYVGHSMGGTVLRYAQTQHQEKFVSQNNYNKGYVNKFITLATPHAGSPFANYLIDLLPNFIFNSYALGIGPFVTDFYKTNEIGYINDVQPAIRDLKMNTYLLNATNFKSHVFIGDMIEGLEALNNVPLSTIKSLNISSKLLYVLKVLTFKPTINSVLNDLDPYYSSFSGSNSIANSDFIVPLNSQLSNLPYGSILSTQTVNFHSKSVGSPSIEMTSDSAVAILLEKPINDPSWGSLLAIQNSTPKTVRKLISQNFVTDTTKIQIFSPLYNSILYVDSLFNLSFSITDTTNLKKIMIIYQDKFIEDSSRQNNYNYSLAVSNNYLDNQKVIISALYLSNDSTKLSFKSIPVTIKSNSNLLSIKSTEKFVYLLKNEDFYPRINAYYDKFIGEIGTTGTTLDVTVANPSIISFNNQTKVINATNEGGTFAIVNYQGFKDTIFFKVNNTNIKDTTVLIAPTLLYPSNNANNIPIDITCTWNSSPDAEKYVLQLSKDSSFSEIIGVDSSISSAFKRITPLQNNTKYFWRVKAINQLGESIWSNIWSFSTIQATFNIPKLASPKNSSIENPLNIKLVWEHNKLAIKYKLLLAEDEQFTKIMESDSTISDSLKEVKNLKEGSKYYWKVNSVYSQGESSFSDIWNFTTLLNAPDSLKTTILSKNKIQLSWLDKSIGETGFVIERKQKTDFIPKDTVQANQTSYIDTTVQTFIEYQYRIKGITTYATSNFSNIASITITNMNDYNLIPTEYILLQNYPNPFNPNSVIRYGLPIESSVRLIVFNTLGQTVRGLVNSIQNAGFHELVFKAENLSSGIYYYAIEAKAIDGTKYFKKVKKMIILK